MSTARGQSQVPSHSDGNLASPLRVVVADRHEAARTRVRDWVERGGLMVVAECGDGASATAAVVRERANVCLIGSDLSGAREAVAAIASLPLAPKAVVLASTLDEHAFFAALEAGAAGYLLDDPDQAWLADELRGVFEGGTALSPGLATRLVERFPSRAHGRGPAPAGLTAREWEALRLLADGLSTKEIALRLRVSATSVRRQISSAVKRMAAAARRSAAGRTERLERSEDE